MAFARENSVFFFRFLISRIHTNLEKNPKNPSTVSGRASKEHEELSISWEKSVSVFIDSPTSLNTV